MSAGLRWILAAMLLPLAAASAQDGEITRSADRAFGGGDGCETDWPSQGMPEGAAALVDGEWILLEEVDEPIMGKLLALERDLADARVRELALQINSRLLEQEAARRGIDALELLRREVRELVAEPTPEELRAFYDRHRERIDRSFAEVSEQIRAHLRSRREEARAGALAGRLRAAAVIEAVEPEELLDPPAWEAGRVLATVNGDAITFATLEPPLRAAASRSARQVHELRRQRLEVLINDRLLDREAMARGIPRAELLESEIEARMHRITELDARRYYDRNRRRLDVDVRDPEGLEKILGILRDRERNRCERELAEELRSRAEVRIILPMPDEMVVDLDNRDQPSRGPVDAPVAVHAFIDYECSSCGWLHYHLDELLEAFAGSLRIVLHDFPLERHPHAYRTALACEAAREQGKFWEYSRLVLDRRGTLDDSRLLDLAGRAGLDLGRFRDSFGSQAVKRRVDRDLHQGFRLGLDATPAVYVNGRRVRLQTATTLRETIEAELGDGER